MGEANGAVHIKDKQLVIPTSTNSWLNKTQKHDMVEFNEVQKTP